MPRRAYVSWIKQGFTLLGYANAYVMVSAHGKWRCIDFKFFCGLYLMPLAVSLWGYAVCCVLIIFCRFFYLQMGQ